MGQAVTHYKDQIYIDLKIEDADLPDTQNMVSTISINESVDTITPVMQFVFYDMQSSIVRQLSLSEATRLKILLGKTKESAVVRNFRKFSLQQQPSSDGPRAIVNFILDCPQYITSAKIESYEGTSGEALSQMASKCGLKADCTSTNDKMIWLNFGNSRGVFAEDVALHGYKEAKSCMLKALTSENVFRYKDVMYEINNTEPKVTFAVNTEQGAAGTTVIQVRDAREKSTSGAMNNWLNYGWKHNEHSLKGESILHKEYSVQNNEKHLPINSDVKSDVILSKINFQKKLDCRNTHENYVKAFYGNTRGRALFNSSLPILIEEPSNVSLLDVVYYRHLDVDKKTNANSGKYIVTGKVTFITNGIFYTEKLILTRFGIVESGNTPLL